jgi:hypothetical protein
MTSADQQALIDQLHASRQRVLQMVSGLSAEQWNFREAPDRWSLAECLEHIATVESRLLHRIQQKLTELPEPEKRPLTAGKDAIIPARVPNRTTKVDAPERLRPTGRWQLDELPAQFSATRARTIEFISAVDPDSDRSLRDHIFPHISLGEIDCYQWLLFIVHHGDRHVHQMEEIKTNPGFPGHVDFSGFDASKSAPSA